VGNNKDGVVTTNMQLAGTGSQWVSNQSPHHTSRDSLEERRPRTVRAHMGRQTWAGGTLPPVHHKGWEQMLALGRTAAAPQSEGYMSN